MNCIKCLLFVTATVVLFSCEKKETFPEIPVNYVETKKIEHQDEYWGTPVADPYRWLEDDNADDTKAWVTAQNEVTFGYLNQIPFRKQLRDRLEEVWNYEKVSAPFNYGEDIYYY